MSESALGDGISAHRQRAEGYGGGARSLVCGPSDQGRVSYLPGRIWASKRPGTGISPMRLDEMVGKQADRDYQTDEVIQP